MADFRIQPNDIIRPTSITLIKRDPLANLPAGLSSKKRIRAFIKAVSLVASTRRDPDKFRADVTTSQRQSDTVLFTKNPVPRGNIVTDHSMQMPIMVQFTGIITETPFISYTSEDFGLAPGQSRVSDYLRQLYTFMREREPLFMASSIRSLDGMAITKLTVSKDQDTGESVEISMTLQQILFVDAVRDEPIPDTLAAQLGLSDIETSVNTVGF